MKKSEAIVLINEILEGYNSCDLTHDDSCAKDILELLISKGFLPPICELEHFSGYKDNSWESE